MRETVSPCLEENLREMQLLFPGDGTLIRRSFSGEASGLRGCLFTIDGMSDSQTLDLSVLRPLLRSETSFNKGRSLSSQVKERLLQSLETKEEDRFEALIPALLYGDAVLFLDGAPSALVIGAKSFMKRSISEPANEIALKGPREGFVEPLMHNLAMLRRRLRTPDLRIEFFTAGTVSKTDCCLCYLSGSVDRKVLSLLRQRLSRVSMDGVLDSNYLSEWIRDDRSSIFRTTGFTERPDVVAAKLLEGRAAVFSDGSPEAITVPYVFPEHFQSAEDYYVDPAYAWLNRFLRISGFTASLLILPVYLSLVTFHQAYMPLSLILSIAKARQDVPFPIFLESLLILTAFDILREAGVRTPSSIGQTLSVVGGLVIGQAAVEARLISVPVLIAVAVSGICALIAPNLKAANILLRLSLMILGVNFGLCGVLLGFLCLLAILAMHRSFGLPYLSQLPPGAEKGREDRLFRSRFDRMKPFHRFLARKGAQHEA